MSAIVTGHGPKARKSRHTRIFCPAPSVESVVVILGSDGNLAGRNDQSIRSVFTAEYREDRLHERTAVLRPDGPVLLDGMAEQDY